MNSLFIAALIRAATASTIAYCNPNSITGNISQAVDQLGGVTTDALSDPANIAAQLGLVAQSLTLVDGSVVNCVVSDLSQLGVATSYATLQPAFLSATTAMTANYVAISQNNQDGAVTDELDTLLATLNTTTADLASAASSEASTIEGVGSTVTSSLVGFVRMIY